MAHFAQLDSNNVVIQVIVVDNKDTADAYGTEKEHIGAAFCERVLGGNWKQTSYNGNKRKNYAGIGYTYRADIERNWTVSAFGGLAIVSTSKRIKLNKLYFIRVYPYFFCLSMNYYSFTELAELVSLRV